MTTTSISPTTLSPTTPGTTTTPGATVWLTGLPSAGKSTLAAELAEHLRAAGRPVEVLDGDAVRQNLTAGLGFSRADRDTNVRRIGWVAGLLARHGVLVLVPVIAPYAATRAAVRAEHEAAGAAYLEIHVATNVEVCAERDVKGLYARARAGELSGLTGVDDPYEEPVDPALRLETAGRPVAHAVTDLLDLLADRGLV